MRQTFPCGHPLTTENTVKGGFQRLVCGTCKAAANRRSRMAVHACTEGQNLSDPNRADKLLRRFSWEAAE